MEEVKKPTCIADYSKHMSGVDLFGPTISYCPFTRKIIKWNKMVFLYLMEISVHKIYVRSKDRTNRNY